MFPTVQGRQTGRIGSNTTSHAITFPGSITAGELLLVIFSVDGNPTVTVGSGTGWTKLGQATNSNVVTQAIFWKIATGSDNLTLSTNNSEQSSWVTMRITGFNTSNPVSGSSSDGSSTNSDPPNHNPGIGANDFLWIATRGGDSTTVASAPPTNYGNHTSIAAAGTAGASTNTAERQLNAASEDPGTWTSSLEQWVCYTLAVWPIPNQPPTITPDTPDESVFSTPTPKVEFTGDDINDDDLTYQTQIDTVDTFDSQLVTSAAADILVYGGGGTGGAATGTGGTGGGGGGGFARAASYALSDGTPYTITVGAAGAAPGGTNNDGNPGGTSSFIDSSTLQATGGAGGGGGNSGRDGGAGGSGSGTAATSTATGGTAGNGQSGASGGSGGGGASGSISGNGGNGVDGGGGNGAGGTAASADGGNGGNGQQAGNAPGGGGGGRGLGADGRVVIRVPQGLVSATGGAYTNDGTYDIWTFTSSGTWTPTFNRSPIINAFSAVDPGFLNEDDNPDTDPFTSGDQISYTVQAGDALAAGTYFWRARAKDPSGSDTWSSWTGTREFTIVVVVLAGVLRRRLLIR